VLGLSRYTIGNVAFVMVIFFLFLVHWNQFDVINLSKSVNSGDVYVPHMQKGEVVNYFQVKEQKIVTKLTSHYLEIQNEITYLFVSPRFFYWNDHEANIPIEISSARGTMERHKQVLYLVDNVEMKQKDDYLNCNNAIYKHQQNWFECNVDVSTRMVDQNTKDIITATADYSQFDTKTHDALLNGSVKGEIQRKRTYDPKTYFEASKINYNAQESKVYLDQKVQVKQQTFLIKSQKAFISLDHYGSKRPNYFTFENQVVLNQKIPNQEDRNGFGEKLEGFLPENYVILTGAPRVEQGKDVTRGNRIILYEKTSMMEVEDAVTSIIYDPEKWKGQ